MLSFGNKLWEKKQTWSFFIYILWDKLLLVHLCTIFNLQSSDFHNYVCKLYLKQPLTPPQGKIIVAYDNANHRLAIEASWGWINPIVEIIYDATLALTM